MVDGPTVDGPTVYGPTVEGPTVEGPVEDSRASYDLSVGIEGFLKGNMDASPVDVAPKVATEVEFDDDVVVTEIEVEEGERELSIPPVTDRDVVREIKVDNSDCKSERALEDNVLLYKGDEDTDESDGFEVDEEV